MPENTTDQRASAGEIAAFVVEANRMFNERDVSTHDRVTFFEWKADLFTRLTRDDADESVVAARDEAARLRAELAGQGAA